MTPNYPEPDFSALMNEALIEAREALTRNEVPVGAVVWSHGKIVGRGSNRTEEQSDPSAHAEVLAMKEAAKALGDWRLNDSVLCVTLEPCTMCLGALRLARVATVVFGASDPRLGAMGSLYDLGTDPRLGGPVPRVISGVKEADCSSLLKTFFEGLREKKR